MEKWIKDENGALINIRYVVMIEILKSYSDNTDEVKIICNIFDGNKRVPHRLSSYKDFASAAAKFDVYENFLTDTKTAVFEF